MLFHGLNPLNNIYLHFEKEKGIFREMILQIINEDGKLDIAKIKPLARLGYYDYTFVDKVFEMRIPGASEKAVDGLEGKS